MDLVMKPLHLEKETRALLDTIRTGDEPLFLYGMEPGQVDLLMREVIDPILQGAALPAVILNQFRWYVRELGGLFRTRAGFDLAFNLELVLRKWLGFGMEAHSMQLILCEAYNRLLRMTPPKDVPDEPQAGAGTQS
jgi:hypothetical protein